jgi:hypothetical protein
MVSKEYVDFFRKYYPASTLHVDGLTPDQQRAMRGKASTYLSRTKEQMREDLEALTLLVPLLPEKHLAEVLTVERIDRLVSALLTESRNKTRSADPHREGMREREYHIAAMLMEKGAMKCLERVGRTGTKHGPEYDPVHDLVHNQLLSVLAVLKYATTGRRGITYDLKFNPKRYEPGAEGRAAGDIVP